MARMIQTFFAGARSCQGITEFHFHLTKLASQNSIVRRGSQPCLSDRQFLLQIP